MTQPSDGSQCQGLADSQSIAVLHRLVRTVVNGLIDLFGRADSTLLWLQPGQQIVGFAEMGQHADGGFAVGAAEAFHDAVVGLPMGGIALEGGYTSVYTTP
jgi:hypothetical protein